MTRRSIRALVVSFLFMATGLSAASEQDTDKPKLTARPPAFNSELKYTSLDEKAAFEFSQSVIGKQVGDFVLLDREGQPVELARYRGKPLLVNFVYTACFQVCPTITRNLQEAVEDTVEVMGPERFNVITIGFNQPFDSPAAMKSFARQYGLDQPNWEFLSPASAIVNELARNFGFRYVATPAGFDHINQVTLVDAEGRIVRQVYGEKFAADALAEPLKNLITGSPIPPEVGTLKEIMERIRIVCSVYDPVTGRYRTDYSLYFEIAGFLTFIGFLIVLSVHFWKNRRRSQT